MTEAPRISLEGLEARSLSFPHEARPAGRQFARLLQVAPAG